MPHEPTSLLSTASESLPETVSVDVLFDVLSHEYRRHALSYLTHAKRPVPVGELVDHVETCVSGSEAQRKVALRLRHVHLPKLDDAGIVDYDPEEGTVEPTGATETLSASAEELTS